MSDWRPIETMPDGVTAKTMIADGDGVRNFAKLKRSGNLFFLPDGSMYVYYTPTHWWPDSPKEQS